MTRADAELTRLTNWAADTDDEHYLAAGFVEHDDDTPTIENVPAPTSGRLEWWIKKL